MEKMGVGKPKIDSSSDSVKISIRIPEAILAKIETLNVGKSTSDKFKIFNRTRIRENIK